MKTTKFYEIHQKLNAKIVDFAGFQMPVHYSSIIGEHKSVRNSVGVFDVSHMGEIFVKGKEAEDFVNYVTINDASKLTSGKIQYSAFCYPDGGIVDDLLVYKINDQEFLLVVNASNKDKDLNWIKDNNKFDAVIDDQSDDYSLLAVQGPRSADTLNKIVNKKLDLQYYTFDSYEIDGIPVLISRTGYTGELGFEIYFIGDESYAARIWNSIFEAGKEFNIAPVGLGARDSLRLEMGFCLYGNDIDQNTNPLEAGLSWITKLNKKDFIGKDSLLKIKEEGLKRKLVGIMTSEKAFPRHGYDVVINGEKIGIVTSGTVSPILDKAVAMAYLNNEFTAQGTKVNFLIRGNEIPAEVTNFPFVKK